MMWVWKRFRGSLGTSAGTIVLCVIMAVSAAGLSGCVQVPHHTWTPTQQYSSDQEVPNFFVCKDFVDKNDNGKVEGNEIEDINPAFFESGDNMTFVVSNPTSWNVTAIVRVYDKKDGKRVQRSPKKKVRPGTIWMTRMQAPLNDSERQYTAIFCVDGRREHKEDFTVLPSAISSK